MSPDFFFATNAIFRHLHDRYGKEALVEYWRGLADEYYGDRVEAWKSGGLPAVAADWQAYFAQEPQADVEVVLSDKEVELRVRVCPAVKHLRDCSRPIVPYFCEHCDHTCGAMAQRAGLEFERSGGMGSCRQRFIERRAGSRQ
jgi:hypothetical protein